jgi:tetratricopeptide (TPR) repeat protein
MKFPTSLSTRTIASVFALLGLTAAAAFAGTEARLHGKVLDPEGNIVEAATITVTTDALTTYHEVWKTNKKGRYSGFIADATLTYTLTVEKPGFQTYKEDVKLDLESTTKKDFTLLTGASAPSEPTEVLDAPATRAANAAINLYNEGATALRAGDFVTARQKLQEAVEKDPDLAAAHGVLALTLVQLKEHEAAVASATRALELTPGEPNALQAQYDAYRALGDSEKAKAAGEALAAAGQNADAARRVFNEGATATREGDMAGAISKFEEAARLDPSLSPAHDALAGLYYTAKRFEEAAAAAEKALEGDPTSLKALQVRAESYRILGQEDKALEALAAWAAADPSQGAEAVHNFGINAFNEGKTDLAIKSFEQAIAIDPAYAQSYFNLGLSHVNAGNSAAAKEAFQKFVEMAPDAADAATAREMMQYLN